ncbi:RNA polymerase sigma-70 factor, ECF subfamily [Chitinophaga costaii]|uniref:RNA polymerase sigma-70 factor, ECF subfamily n=1 Tax=Chitinophaga costaii TaxID=1335309 RepID=A0A1C4AUA3_9BACT|nr:sigma-70 family RNA polymerase sigma factor [Chitinophaga costaii]PUZ26745.1 RNA polymerase subunit sigma-70 [Chitinophaga costaii]SCB98147.1 RNA polymerase sigma-70 factor, ECF subfamily [Chitinophaga costaii]
MASFHVIPDQELLIRLQKGDHAAFTKLYNKYWENLLSIAWNHTKDKCTAEDIVHEVFMALLREKNNFDILSVGAFLATKIKFAVFKHYRKQQRRERLAKTNLTFEKVSLDEEKLDALFLKEYIDGIIETLPEKCKMTFKYSRYAGLKNNEIAAKLSISEKGVEANLTRALKIIKHHLETSGLALILSAELLKRYNL